MTLSDALRSFGGSPEAIDSAAIDPGQVIAFFEPHIEQGPVLQNIGSSLGIVTAIAGQTQASIRFVGSAGHAGTVPMTLRRDAMAAAAEWILQVESAARQTDGLVATVGTAEVTPNVANVIPSAVRLRLDIRHGNDAICQSAVDQLHQIATEIAVRRHVEFHYTTMYSRSAVQTDPVLTGILEQSLADSGVKPQRLVSGAGHDAVVMASRFPVAMLFVRCRDGISHHPDESVAASDVTTALKCMWYFVHRLAMNERRHIR
jgi:allantoate deiminase